ncbi:MAG: DsrE family protein [Nitrospira sp.]|nr:DsrE family protein [Nitrospira sp.]
MEKKRLGVLLSTPPSGPDVDTVAGLCREAIKSNIDVYLYLIDEGVRNLNDERLIGLSGSGAKFFVCAYGCQQHGVATDALAPGVTLCGLVVLSNIINGCDRFVSFN